MRRAAFIALLALAFAIPAKAQFGTWYYRWPSWTVELGSGAVLATAAQPLPSWGPAHGDLFRLAATNVVSVAYECGGVDPNGCEIKDLLQREVGIVVTLTVWHLIRHGFHF